MNVFTLLWAAVAAAAITIEGVALLNSRRNDTLSEHVWAWLGVRTLTWENPATQTYGGRPPTSPVWTLRVARCVLIFGLVWLLLHFTTGGWV